MINTNIRPNSFIINEMCPDEDGVQASIRWPLGIANNEMFLYGETKFLDGWSYYNPTIRAYVHNTRCFLSDDDITLIIKWNVKYESAWGGRLSILVNDVEYFDYYPEGQIVNTGDTGEFSFMTSVGILPVNAGINDIETILHMWDDAKRVDVSLMYCYGPFSKTIPN